MRVVKKDTAENDGSKLFQIQCALSAIIGSAALLYVGFYNTFAFQQWLVGALYQIKQFFDDAFQVRAVGRQVFDFNSIAFT